MEERGLGVALVDDHGAHARCGVEGCQLGGETLVEGEGGCLGGAVVDHLWHGDEGRHGCDGYDHAVVALDEVGEEFLGEEVVRDGVDVKCESDILLRGVENGLSAGNAGVEDKDSWVADGLADLGCDRGDGGRVGDVALEVVDVGWGLEGHWDDVQNDDLDALLGEELDDFTSDAAGAAGDQDNLLRPDILVRDAVVQGLLVEVAVDPADETEVEEDLDALESGLVEDGEVAALLGEACEEDDWEGESWVEKKSLDDWAENFTGEA